MDSFSKISRTEAKNIEVVFCDIDDTISTEGKILPQAYSALWELYNNGIDVVPITGRCAGWVDHIARMWPVRGVVGENGAFYAYMDYLNSDSSPVSGSNSDSSPVSGSNSDSNSDGKNKNSVVHRLKKRYYLLPDEVKEAKKKFNLIKKEVFEKYPQLKVASDQPYREFDLAIDFCEDVPRLPIEDVLQVVKIFEKYGAKTKISSIHVNGWFGDYDKLIMTKIFAEEQLGFSLEKESEKALFIGDSPNDQPMFNFFPISVGVNNVKNFGDLIKIKPKYITNEKSGLGFAEMVKILLQKKNS